MISIFLYNGMTIGEQLNATPAAFIGKLVGTLVGIFLWYLLFKFLYKQAKKIYLKRCKG